MDDHPRDVHGIPTIILKILLQSSQTVSVEEEEGGYNVRFSRMDTPTFSSKKLVKNDFLGGRSAVIYNGVFQYC